MTSQLIQITSLSNCFDTVLFLLSSLVTGLSFVSISSLVMDLWQFSFVKNWPEIQISEIPLSEFCALCRGWSMLGIPNLARMSLIKCYWMLQNAKVTAFIVTELLRENQLTLNTPPSPLVTQILRLGLNLNVLLSHSSLFLLLSLQSSSSYFLFLLSCFHSLFYKYTKWIN